MDTPCGSGWISSQPSALFEALGLEEGVHYEVVVTTFGGGGEPHAAAMGCRVLRQPPTILLRPHASSQTARNIQRSRCGAVNVASPEYIVEAALDLGVLALSFGVGEAVEAPVLCEAYAVVEFIAEDFTVDDVWLQVRCRPVALRYRLSAMRPYSRSSSLLVEAAVRLSRVEPFLSMGRREEALRFLSEARSLLESSARLAGGGSLASIVDAVRERLYSVERRISP
ncbi:MAG: DUF447 family protein [Nitrososphaerota archaeon]